MGADEEARSDAQSGELISQPHGGKIHKSWTPEEAREMQRKSMEKRAEASGKARELVKELLGIDWEDADPVIRGLAENATKGTSADWRLLLQQVGRLKGTETKYDGTGPCPTCGQTPGQGLTITADTIEHLHQARMLLKELLDEDADNVLVSAVGTYRSRGGGRQDKRHPARAADGKDGGAPGVADGAAGDR